MQPPVNAASQTDARTRAGKWLLGASLLAVAGAGIYIRQASAQEKGTKSAPEIRSVKAAAGTLTDASTGEQQGAGLDRCSAEELARLSGLNAAYYGRFGHPFVIAVKGLGRRQILDAIEARLANDAAVEFRTCLREIGKIARFRLDALT